MVVEEEIDGGLGLLQGLTQGNVTVVAVVVLLALGRHQLLELPAAHLEGLGGDALAVAVVVVDGEGGGGGGGRGKGGGDLVDGIFKDLEKAINFRIEIQLERKALG